MKTKLLVSVRGPAEAAVALAAGADLIDVKEPSRGSLGAAADATIAEVVEIVAARRPVSAAFGELVDWDGGGANLHGLSFAKIGLAGSRGVCDWRARWHRWADSLPTGTRPVAVAYADAAAAGAPAWLDVVELAAQGRAAFVLVDTFDKRSGNLLQHWPLHILADFVAVARAKDLGIVLAGSLTTAAIEAILPFAPDYIAVRGAACAGGRNGSLDAERIGELRRAIRGS